MKNSPLLSIVLINYRYFKDLKNCISAILRSDMPFPAEIIVVNVSSGDGTEEFIQQLQQNTPPNIEIKLIQRDSFSISGLRNAGIRNSTGKYILLMDTDLEPYPDAFRKAINFMEKHGDVGVAGFDLFHEDGSSQFNGRSFPTPITILARRSFVGKLFPGIESKHLLKNASREGNIEVDWVSGATMLIRREVVDKIGMLDESFRYGFEDVDFCYRAKKAGWKIYVVGGAKGIHREMRRSKRSLWFAYQHLKSALLYFAKHGWRAILGRI